MFDPIETVVIPDDGFQLQETIAIEDDIDIPSDDVIAIDAPQKVKMTDQNIEKKRNIFSKNQKVH